jgi:hypothetical protein
VVGSRGDGARLGGHRPRLCLQVEELEPRQAPAVLIPAQVRQAYGFDRLVFQVDDQPIRGDGSGQTIAIVVAYHHPRLFGDVDVFSKQFSIDGQSTLFDQYGPARSFLKQAMPQGRPAVKPLWALETALDVQWAHAIAPGADILLVEARSSYFQHLVQAVNYARRQAGVVVVSMSWGGQEFAGQGKLARQFRTPAGHLGGSDGLGGSRLPGGVTFVAASGNEGKPPSWPGTSRFVLSVGGTRLGLSDSGLYQYEVGWRHSGGGRSRFERRPPYQASSAPGSAWRVAPDVAYHADPKIGYYVYSSVAYRGRRGWFSLAGTSAAAIHWAGLITIANQGRALHGLGSLDGFRQTLPLLYTLDGAAFRDIVTGYNGFSAGPGFDPVTGRGSPRADWIVYQLADLAAPPPPPPDESSFTTTTSGDGAAQPLLVFSVWSGSGKRPTPAHRLDSLTVAALVRPPARSEFFVTTLAGAEAGTVWAPRPLPPPPLRGRASELSLCPFRGGLGWGPRYTGDSPPTPSHPGGRPGGSYPSPRPSWQGDSRSGQPRMGCGIARATFAASWAGDVQALSFPNVTWRQAENGDFDWDKTPAAVRAEVLSGSAEPEAELAIALLLLSGSTAGEPCRWPTHRQPKHFELSLARRTGK